MKSVLFSRQTGLYLDETERGADIPTCAVSRYKRKQTGTHKAGTENCTRTASYFP